MSHFMTVGDVAKFLAKSADSVRQYERSGRLPAERTAGGVRVFERSTVERFARELRARLSQ